jgi:peroxiredoxin
LNKFGLVVLLAVLCAFVGCPKDEIGAPEENLTPQETVLVDVGDVAPGFELVTLDGEVFNLEAQRGKVVLVNFFATWCPPCREELPYLEKEIWQRFDPERFSLIVVGREEDDDVIAPFVEKNGYTLPFAGDPDKTAYDKYASRFIPRNFVIGPDGTVLYQSQGFERADFDRMIEVIEEAVADAGDTAEAGEAA